jgi:membrane dipeptidase
VDEYVAHIDYVIKLVGADHVAIGLDMVNGRSSIPADPTGYTDLIAAIRKLTTPENARKILGENWMRVFGQAKAT